MNFYTFTSEQHKREVYNKIYELGRLYNWNSNVLVDNQLNIRSNGYSFPSLSLVGCVNLETALDLFYEEVQ
jgi:hypothetical protein